VSREREASYTAHCEISSEFKRLCCWAYAFHDKEFRISNSTWLAVDVAVVALPNVATARCLPFAASSLASTEDQWCFNGAIGAIMMKSRLTLMR